MYNCISSSNLLKVKTLYKLQNRFLGSKYSEKSIFASSFAVAKRPEIRFDIFIFGTYIGLLL